MKTNDTEQNDRQDILDDETGDSASALDETSQAEASSEDAASTGAFSITPEEAARAEAAEWKEKYLRKFAEFDNFRKRARQEADALGQVVRESMIVTLLPIKDDFDRMLASEIKADDAFHKAVELIHNKLNAFFESNDVRAMEGRGSVFDPNRHDALLMQPTAGFPAGTILEVVTPGYTMGDHVIRHAQVIVSCEPEAPAADDDGSSQGSQENS